MKCSDFTKFQMSVRSVSREGLDIRRFKETHNFFKATLDEKNCSLIIIEPTITYLQFCYLKAESARKINEKWNPVFATNSDFLIPISFNSMQPNLKKI